MFVVPSLIALIGDLYFDETITLDAGLTAESRARDHIEGLVENVFFFVFGFAEKRRALFDMNMAGRTGTYASAGRALGCAPTSCGFEQRRSYRNFYVDGSVGAMKTYPGHRTTVSLTQV